MCTAAICEAISRVSSIINNYYPDLIIVGKLSYLSIISVRVVTAQK